MQHGGHITKDLLGPRGVPVGGGPAFGTGAEVYGVSWDGSSTPTLTRTDDSVGWTCEAGVDAGVVTNDADSAEIFGEIVDVDDLGDGYAYVRIPKFYIRKTATGAARTWQITKGAQGDGYLPACFWDFTNGVELDYVYVGKYPGDIDGGKLRSVAATYPTINTNIVDFRTAAQANGARYQQLDIHVADLLQVLMIVEFATLDLQSVMAGYTTGQYDATHTLTADTNPAGNTLVVANATGAAYAVGQAISVGTSLGGTQLFYGRTITNIQADTPVADSTTITFDGAAVELATGNILYNTGWLNGFSSGIAAASGSLVSNSSGKYPMVYRGIENVYGNVWQFVDGVNINDFQAWVCRDADEYASDLFASPYEQLSYVNHNANGYAVALGHDPDRPFAALATAVTGTYADAGYRDYYYQASGQRIALLGGRWDDGSAAGPFYWRLRPSSAGASVYFGGRLVRLDDIPYGIYDDPELGVYNQTHYAL